MTAAVRRDCAFCGRERSARDDNHAPDCPYWDFFTPGEGTRPCGFWERCDNHDGSCPDDGCILICSLPSGHEGPHSIYGAAS